MGSAVPVVGAVMGIASAVGQHNAAAQQANAQRVAIDQQAMTERHNAQLRLIELERQKLYSEFNFQIQTAVREINRFSDEQALKLAEIQDYITRQGQEFGVRSGTLQERIQTLGLDQSAAQSFYGSEMEAQGILGAETEQGRQALINQANQLASVNSQEEQRQRAQSEAMSQFVGQNRIAGLSMSDIANLQNLERLSQNDLINATQQFQGILDQVRQGKMNASEVANLVRQFGRTESAFLQASAQNARGYLDVAQQANLQDIQANALQNQKAYEAARSALNTAYTIEAAQQELNRSYYDIANQSQANAIRSQSASTLAALATQRSGIVSPSPLNLLGALAGGGLTIAQQFSGRPQGQMSSYSGMMAPNQQFQMSTQPTLGQAPYASFAIGNQPLGLLSNYSWGR